MDLFTCPPQLFSLCSFYLTVIIFLFSTLYCLCCMLSLLSIVFVVRYLCSPLSSFLMILSINFFHLVFFFHFVCYMLSFLWFLHFKGQSSLHLPYAFAACYIASKPPYTSSTTHAPPPCSCTFSYVKIKH